MPEVVPEPEILFKLEIVSEVISELDIVPEAGIFSQQSIVPNPQSVSERDVLPYRYIILDSEIFKSDLGGKIIERA